MDIAEVAALDETVAADREEDGIADEDEDEEEDVDQPTMPTVASPVKLVTLFPNSQLH